MRTSRRLPWIVVRKPARGGVPAGEEGSYQDDPDDRRGVRPGLQALPTFRLGAAPSGRLIPHRPARALCRSGLPSYHPAALARAVIGRKT